MSLRIISPHSIRVCRAGTIARRVTSGGATLVLLLLTACGDSSGPDGGDPGPNGGGEAATLSGTVLALGSAAPLGDATVTIGARQTTSGADGRYELSDVPTGAATVRAERSGFRPVEAAITITAGANTHDFTLTPQDIYVFGTNAVYVPAGVGPMRGAIIVLGGPVASGFVTGERLAPADAPPDLEPGLQALGAGLRALARTAHVALLGSKTTGMANNITSDNALFLALSTAAQMSGRAELADAPLLLFGLSGGGPEAAGLVSRHPERAIGLLVRVPSDVTALAAPAALAVPTFVMQAELDAVVDNARVRTTFSVNRSRGGLWALAVEPAVGHRIASTPGNGAATSWISNALELRLPSTPGEPLIALDESSGWLGNQTTLEIAPWAEYPGDRAAASWLLSESAAQSWQELGTPGGAE